MWEGIIKLISKQKIIYIILELIMVNFSVVFIC